MFERSYFWLCQSYLSAMQCIRMFLFVFQKFMLNLKPNEPNKDLSLYPNSGWFEATHYRRCVDLVLGQNLYFPLLIPLDICSCCSAPFLIHFNAISRLQNRMSRLNKLRIIIILKRIEFSVSVCSHIHLLRYQATDCIFN